MSETINVQVKLEPYLVVHEDKRQEFKWNIILTDSEGDRIVCEYEWLRNYLNNAHPFVEEYSKHADEVVITQNEQTTDESNQPKV